MSVRIFNLAKELSMTSKELIKFLLTQGVKVKSHMSSIEDHVAQILRDRYKPKLPPKEKAPKPGEKPAVKGKAPGEGGAVAHAGVSVGGRGAPGRSGAPSRPSWSAGTGTGRPAGEGDKDAKPRDRAKDDKASPTKRVRFFPKPEDFEDSRPRFGTGRRRTLQRPRQHGQSSNGSETATQQKPQKVEVSLPITLKDLSSLIGVKAATIIRALLNHGHMININQFLNEDLVTTAAVELGIDVEFKKRTADVEDPVRALEEYPVDPGDLVSRAPVVTFLGHVDHGKTSLLDKIRSTSVTQKEAGGITQHLGAYRVDRGKAHVVFIDTPGHEAFTEMRARGANVTDVAVLVVAADDGPMPQTEEALNHARAAHVPVVVAINKVDLPTANVLRAKQQLAGLGLQPVEWGGDTECVEVSALTGQGVDLLLETLSLTSEILELKASPKRPAIGVVLEAEASTSRGVVATILIREGTLKAGDYILCGPAHGRIREMRLNGIKPIKEAGPSTPVQITGLNMVPNVGDRLYVFTDQQEARNIAEDRLRRQRELDRADRQQITRENIFSTLDAVRQDVRIILRADVKGSIEALRSELDRLGSDEVRIKVLHAGVGAITQADVDLATASGALIVGFNVTADERARSLAEERGVDIRTYQIIYRLTEDLKDVLEGKLAPERSEKVKGHAEIRQVFRASKIGNIAGCFVTDGVISRSDQIRLVRDGRIVHTGTLGSLKRFKDDAREVREGFECGLKVTNYDDIKEGDVVEAFAVVETRRQL